MTGFPCPRCGAPTRVHETRAADGGLRRRRCCTVYACGHRFATAELTVGQRWIDGTRTRGPVIAIRYRDLATIAMIVNAVIEACPDAGHVQQQTDLSSSDSPGG